MSQSLVLYKNGQKKMRRNVREYEIFHFFPILFSFGVNATESLDTVKYKGKVGTHWYIYRRRFVYIPSRYFSIVVYINIY